MNIDEPVARLLPNLAEKSVSVRLIDNEFNVDLANQLAELESYNKHLYRPNSYLHKWWFQPNTY